VCELCVESPPDHCSVSTGSRGVVTVQFVWSFMPKSWSLAALTQRMTFLSCLSVRHLLVFHARNPLELSLRVHRGSGGNHY
jgi:hypothetical protein